MRSLGAQPAAIAALWAPQGSPKGTDLSTAVCGELVSRSTTDRGDADMNKLEIALWGLRIRAAGTLAEIAATAIAVRPLGLSRVRPP